jgi:hypothetical protein
MAVAADAEGVSSRTGQVVCTIVSTKADALVRWLKVSGALITLRVPYCTRSGFDQSSDLRNVNCGVA